MCSATAPVYQSGGMTSGRKQSLASERDEREFQFDIRRLETGDAVDVFVETERRWARGTFEVTTDGTAHVLLSREHILTLDVALQMGLRRVLN